MQQKRIALIRNGLIISMAILENMTLLFGQQPSEIVSVFPRQNALHVPRALTITAEFNINMDATTINEHTFIVRGEDSGPLSGTTLYNSAVKTASFELVNKLFAGEIVTVTLTNKILTAQKQPFAGFTWHFTIEAPQPTPPIFTEGEDLLLGTMIMSVYTVDLDKDLDLDLVVGRTFTNEPVVVIRNDGTGKFSQLEPYYLRIDADPIFGNDFDNDGDLVANTYLLAGRIAILINDGSGRFSQIIRFNSTALESLAITTVRDGDIDNDGDVDLIYATARDDSGNGWLGILENNRNADFEDARQIKLRNLPLYLNLSDLNNDGWLDIVAGMGFTVGQAEFWNGMAILLNNQDGSFAEPDYYTYLLGTGTIYCNDFDGDDDIDVAVAINPTGILIFLNDGQGAFPDSVDLRERDSIFQVWGSDFDGDGDIDLLETHNPRYPSTPAVRLYLNPGDGRFSFSEIKDLKVIPDIDIRGYGRPPNGGDLDGDGDIDLVVPFDSSGSWLSFYFNRTDPLSVGDGVANSPADFVLEQNFPNPFNPATNIRFALPDAALVSIKIYNLLGEEIRTLVNGGSKAGFHVIRWDGKDGKGKDAPSGIYIYRMVVTSSHNSASHFTQSRKMTLLR